MIDPLTEKPYKILKRVSDFPSIINDDLSDEDDVSSVSSENVSK